MDKVSYEIIAVYNDTPTFLNIGELNFVYNGNGWVHDLKNGSEILTQLDEICNIVNSKCRDADLPEQITVSGQTNVSAPFS